MNQLEMTGHKWYSSIQDETNLATSGSFNGVAREMLNPYVISNMEGL